MTVTTIKALVSGDYTDGDRITVHGAVYFYNTDGKRAAFALASHGFTLPVFVPPTAHTRVHGLLGDDWPNLVTVTGTVSRDGLLSLLAEHITPWEAS
jgi:hypothetical protein